MQPSSSVPFEKRTKFRQEFIVGNGREFNSEDQFVFETLYQRFATEYIPLPPSEVDAKIETRCALDKQIYLLPQEDTTSTPTPSLLTLDYTMEYTSQYYNVTTYPKLFQNWTNSNLDAVLDQMQVLKLNVTEIGVAKRIIVSTASPTASLAPSMEPTASPSISLVPSISLFPTSRLPDGAIETPGNNILPTMNPTVKVEPEPEPNASNPGMVYVTVASVLSGLILAIGVFFYRKNGRRGGSDEGAETAGGHGRSDPERGGYSKDDTTPAERKRSVAPTPEAFGTMETGTTLNSSPSL